jgi:hypothetical protein
MASIMHRSITGNALTYRRPLDPFKVSAVYCFASSQNDKTAAISVFIGTFPLLQSHRVRDAGDEFATLSESMN